MQNATTQLRSDRFAVALAAVLTLPVFGALALALEVGGLAVRGVGLLLLLVGVVPFSITYYGGWQGRYLYPGLVPAAALLASGGACWLDARGGA
jgi:hypothetical protein